VAAEYEIICLDQNGGISRAIQGAFGDVHAAVATAAKRAPEHTSRIVLCSIASNAVVWEGSPAEARAAGEQ
jgi:hypothetical protein